MEMNMRKEQFSKAYVHAVSTVAGFQVKNYPVDDDSIDVTISASGNTGLNRRPSIDVQLKCTSRHVIDDEKITFSLDVRAYDNLRSENLCSPRILVVVLVPDKIDDWLAQNEKNLALSHCGYWVSLRGEPESKNTTSKTVYLPRSQVFSVEALMQMMTTVNDGGVP